MTRQTRRQFIQSSAIASGVFFATIGSAHPDGDETKEGIKSSWTSRPRSRRSHRDETKEDIKKSIRKQIFNGNTNKAENIMENNDINYNSSKESLTRSNRGNGDRIRANSTRYGSPDEVGTERYIGVMHDHDDIYEVFFQWHLEEYGAWLNNEDSCPLDGAAIYWNPDYFVPEGSGRSNFYNGDQERVSYGGIAGNRGIYAEVNTPPVRNQGIKDTYTGGFSTMVEKVKDGAKDYPIQAEYICNYTDGLCGGFNISFNLGPFGLSTNADVKNWEMAIQKPIPSE